jgi:hypothetical protein
MNPEDNTKDNNQPEEPTAEQKKGELEPSKYMIKSLRTFQDDINDSIKSNKMSTAKIFMAEQKKIDTEEAEQQEFSPKSKKNILRVIASTLLILIGLGAIGYAIYFFISKSGGGIPNIPNLNYEKEFVKIDKGIEIITNDKIPTQILYQR